jgi:hypothetical protein
MAFERIPAFKFNKMSDTGVDQVTMGSPIIVAENGPQIFYRVDADKTITTTTTLQEARDMGAITGRVYDADVWDLIFYADEEDDRVIGMNLDSMQVECEIGLTEGAHAGSCDQAGDTHKMYVRTAATDHPWIEVIDLTTGKWLRKIPLPHKPRSSGGYNKYRRLQAVSTKVYPWIAVIDVDTDTVVFKVGEDTGTPHGNDGGNATGHTVWLDKDHVAMLDRHHKNIQIYKFENDAPPYTVTLTQTIATPTGVHSLRSAEAGLLLSDRVFFAAIEGSVASQDNVVPQMWKMTFDSATGTFDVANKEVAVFPGTTADWGIHHFGVDNTNNQILVPIFHKGTAESTGYLIDIDTWSVSSTTYTLGMHAGHADYSAALNKWAITNHDGNSVTIIDMNDYTIHNVVIPSLTDPEHYGTMTQSHANHISRDGKFYCFFETRHGIFIEIDLETYQISRQTVTGGKPVQSFS